MTDNTNEGGPPPIDHLPMPPAAIGSTDTVPRQEEAKLEAAVRALVDHEMTLVPGMNRSTATVRVTNRLTTLRKML